MTVVDPPGVISPICPKTVDPGARLQRPGLQISVISRQVSFTFKSKY
jgi:hypothetical protein